MHRLRLLAALLLLSLGTGCAPAHRTVDASLRPSTAASSGTATRSPAAGTPPSVAVPRVVRRPVAEAAQTLTAASLRVRRLPSPGTACLPEGRVLKQRPGAGRQVPTGTAVTLHLNDGGSVPGSCGLGLPRAPRALDRAARSFLAFARGESAGLWAPRVELYLGGRLVQRLSAVDAADNAADPSDWSICPGQAYAGRGCPFSAVARLRRHVGPVAVTPQPPGHPCVSTGQHLAARGRGHAVTLTPDEGRTCVDYFAVQLLVDRAGRVTGVNLVLAEP